MSHRLGGRVNGNGLLHKEIFFACRIYLRFHEQLTQMIEPEFALYLDTAEKKIQLCYTHSNISLSVISCKHTIFLKVKKNLHGKENAHGEKSRFTHKRKTI